MSFSATSLYGEEIGLTDESWRHIRERHPEITEYEEILQSIQSPDLVQEGEFGAYLAVRRLDRHFLVVIYREVANQDGFVITAYITERVGRRQLIWSR